MKNSEIKTSVLYNLQILQKLCQFFFLWKQLRTIHEFCMANLPYNEYVKIFSMQIFTAVMGNQGDKDTPLL